MTALLRRRALILIGLGPLLARRQDGLLDAEIEQVLKQLKRVAHHPPGVAAIG